MTTHATTIRPTSLRAALTSIENGKGTVQLQAIPMIEMDKAQEACAGMCLLKFIYSEKATKFLDISTLLLSYVKVSKSGKQIMVSLILPKKDRNSFRIVS